MSVLLPLCPFTVNKNFVKNGKEKCVSGIIVYVRSLKRKSKRIMVCLLNKILNWRRYLNKQNEYEKKDESQIGFWPIHFIEDPPSKCGTISNEIA